MSRLLRCIFRVLPKIVIFKETSPVYYNSPSLFVSSVIFTRAVTLRGLKSNQTFEDKFNWNPKSVVLAGILSFFGLAKDEPDKKESELILTMKRGILATQRGEFKKAEQLFHLALKLAQEQQNQQGVTYIHDLLANLAFDTGEYYKAEKLFISVMQQMISTGIAVDDNKVVHISLKLAKIYEETRDMLKAEQGYQYCVNKLEKRLTNEKEVNDDTLLLWAMTLDWYARFLLKIGKVSEAFSKFEKSYEICAQVNGKNHEQSVVLLNDLGTAASMMGDAEAAIEYLTEATKIGKTISDMADLPSIYINLGHLYMKKGLYDESRKACEEGYKLARKNEEKDALAEAKKCLSEIREALKSR